MARSDTGRYDEYGNPIDTNMNNDPDATAPLPQEGDGIVAPPVTEPEQPEPEGEGGILVPGVPEPGTTQAPQASTDVNLDRGLLSQATSGSAPQIAIDGDAGLAPTTREVQDNELVSNQLNSLLASDSQYMRQARLAGLSMGGGLGGTAGIRGAVGEAIRRGLPIATADAQAFRDAAAQNMNALNQFTLATMQRITSLELGNLDAATRIQTTKMNNAMQAAVAKLNAATSIKLANLDAQTKVRITELNGLIQERLSNLAFEQNKILNDQQNAARLEQIAVQGEYNLAGYQMQADATREANYINAVMQAYDGALNRLSALDGIEMDDAARRRAEEAVWQGAGALFDLLNHLYPDADPITIPSGG